MQTGNFITCNGFLCILFISLLGTAFKRLLRRPIPFILHWKFILYVEPPFECYLSSNPIGVLHNLSNVGPIKANVKVYTCNTLRCTGQQSIKAALSAPDEPTKCQLQLCIKSKTAGENLKILH